MVKNEKNIVLFSCHSSVFDPKCLEVQFKYIEYNVNLFMHNTPGISDLGVNFAYSKIRG